MNLSNENVIHIKKDEVEYLQFRKLLEYQDTITHAFTLGKELDYRQPRYNRECPISLEQIELNKQSYKKMCNAIGIEYKDIVKTNQTHSDRVQVISKKVQENAPDFTEECYDNTDGLITNKKKLAICATNADCIVLMMFDKKNKVIANVHSGWKGTVQKIAAKTIDKMEEAYNCNPKDIICCISPSIRKCHFEVDADVKDIFVQKFINIENVMERKQNKWHIDTVEINKQMLKAKGLLEENIMDSKICTVCNSDIIHSYRGSNHRNGLEMSIIELK